MTNESKSKSDEGIKRDQSPYAIFPKPLRKHKHGLYMALECHDIDGRTRLARVLRGLTEVLLEGFPVPVPGPAQLLAQRVAVKLLRVVAYETVLLGGRVKLGDRTEANYLTITNSIRADLLALGSLAREGQPPQRVPSLQQYLEALREGKLIAVGQAAQEEG